MPQSTTTLERQVARARRRLFLTAFLTHLAWCWAGALAVAALWFVVGPYLVPEGGPWLRWGPAGALVGASTLLAVLLAVRQAPSAVQAALALDERFGLKERVVTSLTLSKEQAAGTAGQALLADLEPRLKPLAVGKKFPVSVPWKPASLVPLGVLLLVLLALFWNPAPGSSRASAGDLIANSSETREEINKEAKELARKKQEGKKPSSKQMEEIQADLDKFARQERKTEEDVRDGVKALEEVEEKIKKQQKAEAERVDALRDAMKQIDRLKKKGEAEKKQEGPGKDLAKALDNADFEKAREEAERLQKQFADQAEAEEIKKKLEQDGDKLPADEKEELQERLKKKQKDRPLTEEEKKQIEDQLEDMKDKADRLSRSKEEQEKDLKDRAEKGEIDREQLERELEELKKNAEEQKKDPKQAEQDKKDLQELAEKLAECEKCMKEGKDKEAAEKMGEIAKKMGQMDKSGDQEGMARQLAQLRKVRKVMARALNGGGPGAGRRPESKEGDTAEVERRERVDLGKGKMEVVGTGPGKGFKGPVNPDEIRAEIREAAQQAPAAIDRQRLPASAKKMARDYFEKVRGDKEKK